MRDGNHQLPRASSSVRPSSILLIVGLVSVTANILLAGMLARNHAEARISANSLAATRTNSNAKNQTTSETAAKKTTKDPLADFRWSQIEDADRQQYIRNLRAFDVP